MLLSTLSPHHRYRQASYSQNGRSPVWEDHEPRCDRKSLQRCCNWDGTICRIHSGNDRSAHPILSHDRIQAVNPHLPSWRSHRDCPIQPEWKKTTSRDNCCRVSLTCPTTEK